MLKQRLITAVILIPLVVWGILQLPTPYLALVLALFILQGSWEWSGFMRLSSVVTRGIYTIIAAASLLFVWFFVSRESTDWLALPVISIFWWLLAGVWVLTYPKTSFRWSSSWLQSVIGILVLVPTWLAVVGLHERGEQGPYLVLYLLSLIWIADSGAYFGGKRWGKHKLAPEVSPGKTWEGVISAFVASTAYALFAINVFDLPGNQWLTFIVLTLVTVAFSILGSNEANLSGY